ncbi:hypothetical protein B0H15DRAFT_262268 [Mycena belliarum]|uniref:Fungal-type protein kinase domain-containing protein n=1 Tax=Mycena belliarum TaxID=1033014 RepID=A0AAD6XN66_9AGAR|nr:hypothetical protein B0H15DRAFT_262268 [Mycena belliae]
MMKHPFAEPLLKPASYNLEDVRSVFIDAFLTCTSCLSLIHITARTNALAHYVHTNFPNLLNDTLSVGDIRFHRTESQGAVCVLVDLDGIEHPSNPTGRPSSRGTIPFNAYDRTRQPEDADPRSEPYNPSLYTPAEDVNTGAPYRTYRHILEALFFMLLWCVSDVPNQTLGWMERGHVSRHELLRVLKHPRDREAFMWDATSVFKGVGAEFAPLIEAWLRPLWVQLSEAHFLCRLMAEDDRNRKLDDFLTFNKLLDILRTGDADARIPALIPIPDEDFDEGS